MAVSLLLRAILLFVSAAPVFMPEIMLVLDVTIPCSRLSDGKVKFHQRGMPKRKFVSVEKAEA